MTPIEKEKIGAYVKFSKDAIKSGMVDDDYIQDLITIHLIGHVYATSKEQGEFTVYVQRPTFLDWLLRRGKTIIVPYTIRQLIKKDLIPDALPTIEIKY